MCPNHNTGVVRSGNSMNPSLAAILPKRNIEATHFTHPLFDYTEAKSADQHCDNFTKALVVTSV